MENLVDPKGCPLATRPVVEPDQHFGCPSPAHLAGIGVRGELFGTQDDGKVYNLERLLRHYPTQGNKGFELERRNRKRAAAREWRG